MAQGKSEPNFEARLLAELADIDRRIADLTSDRRAIERLLLKARRSAMAGKDVSRKNSLGRILVERTVLATLGETEQPRRGVELFRIARGVDYELKDVTFRSYLHRMKQKGLIENPRRLPGWWRAVPSKRTSDDLSAASRRRPDLP